MASNQKEVKVKVATKEELDGVEALELRINKLQKQKIQVGIDIASQKLEETQARIEQLKEEKAQVQLEVSNANRELDEIQNKIEGIDHVIYTSVDLSDEELEELKAEMAQLKKEKIKIEATADDSRIKKIDGEIAKLEQRSLDFEVSIESGQLNKLKAELDGIDGKIDLKSIQKQLSDLQAEKVDIKIDVDDNEVKSTKMIITDINGEYVGVDVDVDGSSLKDIQKEIDGLKGENIDISVHVDDSEIKNAQKEVDDLSSRAVDGLGSTQNAVTGLISGMGANNIWDTIYGTSKRAETNKILLKNMADVGTSYDTLYNTIDTTTDKSLISMQSLIPGLNGIKSATGATATEINNITPKVAQFGQFVLALTGSEAKAETAMFDLSKGIKGMYASLDQYGITEDSLMATGLWSGKEDDIEGYIAAVNEVTGSTDELMESTQGLEALMGKAFSRGGKKIGNELLPHVKDLLNGFIDLDSATGGWLSTAMLIGGGAVTGLTTFLSTAGQALNGIKMMKDAVNALRDAEILQEAATKMAAVAQGIYNAVMDANPIMLIVTAIIVLIAVLGYLYFNNEQVRQAVDSLGQSFILAGQIIYTSFMNAINWIIGALQNFYNYVMTLGGLLPQNVNITGNQIIDSILAFLAFFATLPIQIGIVFVNILAKALGFGDNFVQRMINAAINTVTGFINKIRELPGMIQTEFGRIESIVSNFITSLPQRVWDLGASIVSALKSALGIGSPGHMYYMFEGELKRLDNLPGDMQSSINRNVSLLGSGIVDSFGEPSLGLKYEDTMNSQLEKLTPGTTSSGDVIYNFNLYGDMDNENRMKQFLEYARKEMNWNNSTSGRTI